ncbi:GAF domain-containing sensor histidine kinase [Variovorax sp. RHLX14]|uniref:GAF domain-containing sensor histidine kinase n=1 Tax=Variovorax sp. RHLX14 TaxID=1259731 RepID=UPI003F483F2D
MTPSATRHDARVRANVLRQAVQRIEAVPVMLRLISEQTQLRFSAVAHVSDELWVACAVHDQLDFGLSPGSELPVETTLCIEARNQLAPIVIEHASADPVFCHHQTPRLYKFESYVSVPILLRDGSHFGNLCALDPLPRPVADPKIQAMFAAYAALLGHLLDGELMHEDTVQLLAAERSLAVSREQFIAVVAHDLRNPLSAIASGTELITRFGDPAMSRVSERMRASTQRMSVLLNDLVDFARGRAGNVISINLSPRVDLARGLASVVHELQDANPEVQLIDELTIDGAVVCDLSRLQQLLSNLIANAIAYGSQGTPILVRAFIANDEAVLSVTNQGAVIAQAELDRMFDPYWRSNSQDQGNHLGLGLHICAQIAKAHRGTLTAASAAQAGTRFELRWPVA